MNAIERQQVLMNYLQAKGIDASSWDEITNPTEKLENDPFLITGMRDFLNQLYHVKDKVITIDNDYDADGVLSMHVLFRGLKLLNIGTKINVYVPTRQDGYGLTPVSVQKIKEQFPDTEVLITADNGIAAFDGVLAAKQNGWDVLITDHHLAKPEGLPKADGIIDINQPDDQYPFKGISGTTMVYKTLLAYASIIQPVLVPAVKKLKLFAGLSAVTDMMPMRHENRYYTKYALLELQQMLDDVAVTTDKHISILMAELKAKGRLYSKVADAELIGFQIGPILNAPSRVTGSPELAFKFFLTDDEQEMKVLADQLIANNDRRKSIVNTTASDIIGSLDDKFDSNPSLKEISNAFAVTVPLTAGFVGLVAGDIERHFNRPAIAFSTVNYDGEMLTGDAVLHGSARSPEGVSIVEKLQQLDNENPGLILGFGGHAAAAGLTIPANRFDEFNEKFNAVVSADLEAISKLVKGASDQYMIDVKPYEIDNELINMFDQLGPYGQTFEKPTYKFTEFNTRINKTMSDGKHIKFTDNGVDAVWWNGTNQFERMGQPEKVNLTGAVSISEFMGKSTVQMIVDTVFES